MPLGTRTGKHQFSLSTVLFAHLTFTNNFTDLFFSQVIYREDQDLNGALKGSKKSPAGMAQITKAKKE